MPLHCCELFRLQDLKEAQPSLGRGLQQLLDFEGDVEAVFERSFQISYEVIGEQSGAVFLGGW